MEYCKKCKKNVVTKAVSGKYADNGWFKESKVCSECGTELSSCYNLLRMACTGRHG